MEIITGTYSQDEPQSFKGIVIMNILDLPKYTLAVKATKIDDTWLITASCYSDTAIAQIRLNSVTEEFTEDMFKLLYPLVDNEDYKTYFKNLFLREQKDDFLRQKIYEPPIGDTCKRIFTSVWQRVQEGKCKK